MGVSLGSSAESLIKIRVCMCRYSTSELVKYYRCALATLVIGRDESGLFTPKQVWFGKNPTILLLKVKQDVRAKIASRLGYLCTWYMYSNLYNKIIKRKTVSNSSL